MSFLSFIWDSLSTRPKIYRSNIEKIPSSTFVRQAVLIIDGEKKALVGRHLRDYLAFLAKNGITLKKIEEKLKEQGLKNSQIQRRKEIIKILEDYIK
jgi:hypothetical protein